jgi:hypothetical protein
MFTMKEQLFANFQGFSIVIASLPNRDQCVCEIYYKNDQWVEISNENDEKVVRFYSHPFLNQWEFPLKVAMEILQKANEKFS